MPNVQPILDALRMRNWYLLAALVLLLVVHLFRNAPVLKDVWLKVPDAYRSYLVHLGAGVVAFVAAFQAGLALPQALLAGLGGVLGISIPAMGMNAALTESPIPWNGGACGRPRAKDAPKTPRVGMGAACLAALMLCAACTPAMTGAVANVVSSVVSEVLARSQQAATVIDMAEDKVDENERLLPPDVVKKLRDSISALRAANAAAAAAATATELTAAQAEAAFEPFRREWKRFMEELGALGLAEKNGKFKAAPGEVVIPEPLALKPFEGS